MKVKIIKTGCLLVLMMSLLTGCQQNSHEQQSGITKSMTQSKPIEQVKVEDLERPQVIQSVLDDEEKPQLSCLQLSGVCSGRLGQKASIRPYANNVYFNATVGLIGTPFEVTVGNDVKEPLVTVTYRAEELRGVPEKNIKVFHVYEKSQIYSSVEDITMDTGTHTVSFVPKENGLYLLVDIYAYGSARGWAVSEYAYESDKTSYESDWERMSDTGDIMKLTDKEWVRANAPEFHVSTAEQLASVVYYSNVIGGSLHIYLEDDIDLKEYSWVPMGWYNINGETVSTIIHFDGQGHTIDNMTMNLPKQVEVGLTGNVVGLTVENLTMRNASVSGLRDVGMLGGQCNGTKIFTNLTISGRVQGDRESTAALVGWGGGTECVCENCELDITVNGQKESYLTANEKTRQLFSDDSLITLSINEQGQVQRTELSDTGNYKNLSWVIRKDGKQLLRRGADHELTIPAWVWEKNFEKGKTYTISMEVYSSSVHGYIDCSNTLTFNL